MKLLSVFLLMLSGGEVAVAALVSLPVPADRGKSGNPLTVLAAENSFRTLRAWNRWNAEPAIFDENVKPDLTGEGFGLWDAEGETPEFFAEAESCEELITAAVLAADDLNSLNRQIFDISAARAAATGQRFQGKTLSAEETQIMTALWERQKELAGGAQEAAYLVILLEGEAARRGCVFMTAHQRNLDPFVESEPHYLSRENADAVHRVQVAPYKPVRARR